MPASLSTGIQDPVGSFRERMPALSDISRSIGGPQSFGAADQGGTHNHINVHMPVTALDSESFAGQIDKHSRAVGIAVSKYLRNRSWTKR